MSFGGALAEQREDYIGARHHVSGIQTEIQVLHHAKVGEVFQQGGWYVEISVTSVHPVSHIGKVVVSSATTVDRY